MAENDFGISNWAFRTVDEGFIGDIYRWPYKWYKRKKLYWQDKLTPSILQGKSRIERKYLKFMKVKGMNLAIATSLINAKEDFEDVRDLKKLTAARLMKIHKMDEKTADKIIEAIKKGDEQPVDKIKISEFVKDLKARKNYTDTDDSDDDDDDDDATENHEAKSLKDKLAADKEQKAKKKKPDTAEDGGKTSSWFPWSK